MTVTINGTTGIAGTNGSAATPAVQGEDTNTGLFFPAADTVAVSTGGSERLRLDASGNLGLGVTPSAWSASFKAIQFGGRGSVWSATDTSALAHNLYNDGAGNKRIATDFATLYQQQTGQHQWLTAASNTAGSAITFTQAMTLDASGNLLVGTTSLYGTGITLRSNATSEFTAPSVTGTATVLNIVSNLNPAIQLRGNGGIANYSANNVNLSDERVKTDIAPVGSYWDKIKALQVVTYKYRDHDQEDSNIGVIAQQVESVAPEFVSNDGFGETPEDGIPLKTIYEADLHYATLKALQEAMARIETLEARIAALET